MSEVRPSHRSAKTTSSQSKDSTASWLSSGQPSYVLRRNPRGVVRRSRSRTNLKLNASACAKCGLCNQLIRDLNGDLVFRAGRITHDKAEFPLAGAGEPSASHRRTIAKPFSVRNSTGRAKLCASFAEPTQVCWSPAGGTHSTRKSARLSPRCAELTLRESIVRLLPHLIQQLLNWQLRLERRRKD